LLQDSRYALRTLGRNPGFTSGAVLTLALGIGANSAIFSFVDGVLLKPLPYRDPDRIVFVWERPAGGGRNVVSALNFLDWRDGNRVFEHIAAATGGSVTLTGIEEPVQIRGARVSASYFQVFGITPALGRTFARDEDQPGRDRVVVLSHRLWVTQFGADAAMIGRSLTLDGQPYVVIGVLPEGSAFDRGSSQLWRPLAFRETERTRDFHWLQVLARLKSGEMLDSARTQMDALGARIARDYPDSNKGWGVTVERYADVLVGPQLRRSLYVLLGAVGMLLLIACANLANLMLARGTARGREVAVRAALGAGRWRLMRQFLTESALLSLSGGVLGLAVGYGMMAALKQLLPPFMLPREAFVTLDMRLLAFTLGLSVVTGVVFGLVPALHATRLDLASAVKEEGRGLTADVGRRRLRGALVVVEVALAFVLLTGAGLLVRSFFSLLRVDPGFDETNVLTMSLPVAQDRFQDPSELTLHFRQILARVDALPGVRAAALTSALPMQGWGYGMPFQIAGGPTIDRANRRACGFKIVSPSYFRVLGMKLRRGRGLSDEDVKGSTPVTIINEPMAAQYFTGADPIGQRILVQEIVPGKPQLGPEIPWEVVGVVAEEKTGSLDNAPSPVIYVPLEQSPITFMSLVLRTEIDPGTVQPSLGRAIREVDKDQALADVRTLTAIRSDSTASTRLRPLLLAIFAGLALLLSAIGIYGVIAYSVAQRTHEIGIRAALGASTGSLMRMVLRHGMMLAAIGLVVGLGGALGLTRLLGSLLFGVTARDPFTMVTALATLAGVASIACYVPARRAARMDPPAALRQE
jgi:putative ABC transport system permease protein